MPIFVIIFLVTCVALNGRVLETPIGVAVITCRCLMPTFKPELRLVVIETRTLPFAFAVTLLAFVSESVLVNIILAMAGNAFFLGVAKFFTLFVTTVALVADLFMTAFQSKTGLFVIELFLVDRDHFRVAAFVFGMTVAATTVIQMTVKTFPGADILGNFLVAALAQLDLRIPIESKVAALAVILILGMRRRQLARHQGPLDRLCVGADADKGQHHRNEAQQHPARLNTCVLQ